MTPGDGWRLNLAFDDGREGWFDVTPYLHYEVFRPLKDEAEFAKVWNGGYYVEWACGAGLSADTLEAYWQQDVEPGSGGLYFTVRKVKALPGYQLEITFETKEVKIFDMKPYLDLGVFKVLKDETFFQRARVALGSVEWPGGIDIAPETLYENGKPAAALGVAEEDGVYEG